MRYERIFVNGLADDTEKVAQMKVNHQVHVRNKNRDLLSTVLDQLK